MPNETLLRRLREAGNDYTVAWGNGDLYDEAADEIERLHRAASPQRAAPAEPARAVCVAYCGRLECYRERRCLTGEITAAQGGALPALSPLRQPDEELPSDQWIGDVTILQVLADSVLVNPQEREVLQRWIARPPAPGSADNEVTKSNKGNLTSVSGEAATVPTKGRA